ncbi:MAG: CTP synthase [Oscillospiraceae bacterium]|jgi:CTP synthase|nr:CTP synthase [Oscillospiraceae bacterium]
MSTKYIFITGGVVSGLGKGITGASLGRLLKQRGLKVRMQKFDLYLNVDPGTMSPYQHGEVFVTEDGTETDLDLGHYERFIDENLDVTSNVTAGKVYWSVITKERKGGYLGETIQVIPHITNEIMSFIFKASDGADIVITEIGGTVGDIEGRPFLEAIRQVRALVERGDVLYIHVSLLPFVIGSDEVKTKPTQHSVKELLSVGIQPDVIVCRADRPITPEIREKLALFCNIAQECVIYNPTVDLLYEIPLVLQAEGLDSVVCRTLGIDAPPADMTEWSAMVDRAKRASRNVTIAICGKYVELHDAYLSVVEALRHAGIENGANVAIKWVDSDNVTEENAAELLSGCDGILVPGGFGERGITGMIVGAKYARERDIPYFGICLGLQVAAIEFARNVCQLYDADSREFAPDGLQNVIDLMEEQRKVQDLGGTMRLGHYPCTLQEGTRSRAAYGAEQISERHRHRYELNNSFREILQAHGLKFAGLSPDSELVEIVELPDKRWFVGVQFHPELKSRPNRAHPLFRDFVAAALDYKESR